MFLINPCLKCSWRSAFSANCVIPDPKARTACFKIPTARKQWVLKGLLAGIRTAKFTEHLSRTSANVVIPGEADAQDVSRQRLHNLTKPFEQMIAHAKGIGDNRQR